MINNDITLLDRRQLDTVLAAYCEQINVSYSTLHEDAFCVQGSKGYWLYLWYDENGNYASHYIKEIEKLVKEEKLNLRRSAP